MNEVRSTGDSEIKRIVGQARPEQEELPADGGAWGGWRRNVRKCLFVNQGDLFWCWKERNRRQSPRSSCEAGNDRGAKGDRKVEAKEKYLCNNHCRECPRGLSKAESHSREMDQLLVERTRKSKQWRQ